MVFVTPESAMTKGFADFITRKQEMHQLDRKRRRQVGDAERGDAERGDAERGDAERGL